MKYLLITAILVSNLTLAADVYVQPHTRSDGTYVEGHYRTAPDSNPYNNYSTQGNTNPYTGQEGRVQPNQYPVYQPVQPPTVDRNSGYCQNGRCQ